MVTKFFQVTAVLAAICTMIFVGWLFYLFHEEDYRPEPGSISFYLKLSSLVRNIPIIDAVSMPSYYGSIGDGPKPAESSVCYEAQSSKEVWIVANTGSYLHARGFALALTDPPPRMFQINGREPSHLTAYANEDGESVHLMLSRFPNEEDVEVCLTHFE
jgi:hypothetical protein